MLVGLILLCEVMFWVVLGAGLTARYLLGRPRAGAALLMAAPLVDLVLLIVTALDLRGGGTATGAHSLAAVYIGVSVGFGHRMIAWADVRFAHRYAGGPAPVPKPRTGRARAAHERANWWRHLVAWGVGVGLLALAVLVVGDSERTAALTQTIKLWTLVLGIDAAISWSYSLRPKSPEETTTRPTSAADERV